MYHLFPRELSIASPSGAAAKTPPIGVEEAEGGEEMASANPPTPPWLQVAPVAEVAAHLRTKQLANRVPVLATCTEGRASAVPASRLSSAVLGKGSQLDIVVQCNLDGGNEYGDRYQPRALPDRGQVAIELLADPGAGAAAGAGAGAGAALVVGYDFASERLFVDHSRMGNNSLVQTAPLPRGRLQLATAAAAEATAVTPAPTAAHGSAQSAHRSGENSSSPPPLLRVLLDGAMIESFGGGSVALTSFVTPTGTAAPADRVVRMAASAASAPKGMACNVSIWELAL